MNTIASDVAPAVTPSIGSGKTSASVPATSNPATPASVDQLGQSTASAWIAATTTNAPAAATGRTMGRVRLVSAGKKTLGQRRRRRRFRNRLPYGPSARSVMPLAPIAARRKAASAGIQYATEVRENTRALPNPRARAGRAALRARPAHPGRNALRNALESLRHV